MEVAEVVEVVERCKRESVEMTDSAMAGILHSSAAREMRSLAALGMATLCEDVPR
jgi:hypothetical protein